MKRTKADRRFQRYVHGMRRIREDCAQHGADHRCLCFSCDGRTFSRFADTPKSCSCSLGCGNPRRHWGDVTRQELRAPTASDWSDVVESG